MSQRASAKDPSDDALPSELATPSELEETTSVDMPAERPLSWRNPLDGLALAMIGLVRIYQWTLSPLIGQQCRFEPSCSRYFIGAVRKYGAIRGAWRGACRIARCHPFHPGGHDPP